MDFESYAADRRKKVEERLAALLPAADRPPRRFHEAMRYAVLGGGKRFRPLLCLAAAEAVGGSDDDALDAACAVEMVHCFSLIHDDLPALDNDDLRRGKPTVHVAFDEATAILAGDALFALAFETLANMNGSDEIRYRAMKTLARASGTDGMVGGQTADVESERCTPELDAVRSIHDRKAGALIAASCEIGAVVAGGSETDIACSRKFGQTVGLAFQITDDVLNETGDQAALGKRTRTDRQRRKATFPAAVGIEESRRMATEAYETAVREIQGFGGCGDGLRLLARFAVERSS